METAKINEQLQAYGIELGDIIHTLKLFQHNVETLSLIEDDRIYTHICKEYHTTQFMTIQALLEQMNAISGNILNIAESDNFSPSREEVVSHYVSRADKQTADIDEKEQYANAFYEGYTYAKLGKWTD